MIVALEESEENISCKKCNKDPIIDGKEFAGEFAGEFGGQKVKSKSHSECDMELQKIKCSKVDKAVKEGEGEVT